MCLCIAKEIVAKVFRGVLTSTVIPRRGPASLHPGLARTIVLAVATKQFVHHGKIARTRGAAMLRPYKA
jgi:hypothetical protein